MVHPALIWRELSVHALYYVTPLGGSVLRCHVNQVVLSKTFDSRLWCPLLINKHLSAHVHFRLLRIYYKIYKRQSVELIQMKGNNCAFGPIAVTGGFSVSVNLYFVNLNVV